MSPTDRILRLLSEKPGLRAQQIAAELELERSQVAALLHGLSGEVTQDSSYRWWLQNPWCASAGASRSGPPRS